MLPQTTRWPGWDPPFDMLFRLIVENLATTGILLLFGGPVIFFLKGRIPAQNSLHQVFLALVSGFFLFESSVAILSTKGATVQWLNLLPFVYLFTRPRQFHSDAQPPVPYSWLLIPLAGMVAGSLYFLKSYASGFTEFDRQPFIDLISYSGTAFSIGQSGIENASFQKALFFPAQTGLGVYHFTELWFSSGIARILGISETYVVSIILPVQILVMMISGILGESREKNWPQLPVLILGLALPFANYKTLFGDDVFLYNFLDLTGLKVGLLWVTLLFLWRFRGYGPSFFSLALLLPQENILFVPLVALLYLCFIWLHSLSVRELFSHQLPVLYAIFAGTGLLILFLFTKKGTGHDVNWMAFTAMEGLSKSSVYFREGVFNLGLFYWWPALLVFVLFYEKRYVFFIVAVLGGKIAGKGLGMGIGSGDGLIPVVEIVVFFLVLWLTDNRFRFINRTIWGLLFILLILCFIGGIGNAATHHMDYEQIFSIFSCAVFPVAVVLGLIHLQSENGLLTFPVLIRWRTWLSSSILLMLTLFTFRWQRVESFDLSFYREVKDVLRSDPSPHFAGYLSIRKLYPFPAHIQAGLPLMMEDCSMISTPLNVWEDKSWAGTERESQVLELAYSIFSNGRQPQNRADDMRLKTSFLKTYQIRYLWKDKGYPDDFLRLIQPAVLKIVNPGSSGPSFIVIDPTRL